MVSGDAILGATALVGVSVLTAGWRLASQLARIGARLDNQDEKVSGIAEVVSGASLLNGKGDALVRDVAVMKNDLREQRDDLRQHLVNSETTHAAMWGALRYPGKS